MFTVRNQITVKAVGVVLLVMVVMIVKAATDSLTINLQNPGITTSPLLYGIFFEEINRAGDGGIYGEMVRNRSFEEDTNYPMAWTATSATVTLDTSLPLNTNNPTSLRVVAAAGGKVSNCSFVSGGPWWDLAGMQTYYASQPGQFAVEAGKIYDVSLYVRASNSVTLTVSIISSGGSTLASQSIAVSSAAWTKFPLSLTPSQTDANCRLQISTATTATFWLDMVSMFPHETWNGRTNGLRADLMAKIETMHPKFVRFPGGCFVEGRGVETRVQWKKTIGPVEQRPGHYNIIWGYYSTDGLGYLEYLQMCEDLGAEPLFVINCGMGHATNNAGLYAVPLNEMGPFVQDALDAIEYANGSTNTTWGAKRAADGHPAPFNLKYMEIGNEEYGTDYSDRYALMSDAIKAAYTSMRLIANERTASRRNDIVDPHLYSNPTTFLNAIDDWDNYSRTDPKIYVGEYAVTEGAGTGNLRAALAEAAYLTGLERNSDVVLMSSYAPLFCRTGWRGWNPNAILFDQSQVYGTPSYWVQTMYAANRGDRILPVQMNMAAATASPIAGKIGVGTWGGTAMFKDIVVSNQTGQVLYQSNFTNGISEWQLASGKWSVNAASNALVQTDAGVNGALAKTGDITWTNYTLTLKARKISGNEGFLITFGSIYDGEKSWWNLGGWGNTAHGVESPGLSTPNVAGSIATNQWYNIKIVLQGTQASFYLNGALIHSVTRTAANAFTALGGRDNTTGDTILKFVNTSTESRTVSINLQGGNTGTNYGRAWVLTSTNELDENSFSHPTHITPIEDTFTVSGTNFSRLFPANSVTVLRVGAVAGAPAMVSGLAATGADSSVQLTWSISGGVAGYNVKRSSVDGGPYVLIATNIAPANYTDTGLAGGTTYYYVVSAVSASGEGANSWQASASTLAGRYGSLLHRYSFSETNGTTVADSIGGPMWNGGLPNGGTWAGDRLTLLPASSQFANLPAGIVSSLSNFTLMAWVNLNSAQTWSRIFDFGNSTTSYMFLTPQIGGTMRFAVTTNGNGAEQQINCSAAVSTNAWHQIAVTLNTNRGVLYLDGVAVGTNSGMTLNAASLGVTTNNYLGKSQWPDPYMDGALEEFRIYNIGLSAAEVAATYALGFAQQLSTNNPPISLTRTAANPTLSWPLANAGFTVQSRTNLTQGNWTTVASPVPQIIATQWLVTVPVSSRTNAVFYRLAK